MNTPSKEALEAAKEFRATIVGLSNNATDRLAAIIDRHFEPLRRDNAALAGRLTAAELERDGLGARAEALLRETEAVAAQGATQYVELNRKFAELPALRARVKELESEKAGITDALYRTAHSEKMLHARVKELEAEAFEAQVIARNSRSELSALRASVADWKRCADFRERALSRVESAAPLPMREDPRYRGTDFRSAIDVDRASQEGSK